MIRNKNKRGIIIWGIIFVIYLIGVCVAIYYKGSLSADIRMGIAAPLYIWGLMLSFSLNPVGLILGGICMILAGML